MRHLPFIFFLIACGLSQLAPAAGVLAPDANNALLSYSSQVFMPGKTVARPSAQEIEQAIYRQSSYLLGLFENKEFTQHTLKHQLNGDLGIVALSRTRQMQVTDVSPKENGTLISYRVAQEILIHKAVLNPGQATNLQIYLPVNPFTYYDSNCVSPDGPWPEYYFAFWWIFQNNCAQHIKTGEVQSISAKLEGLVGPSQTVSPAYDRLQTNIKVQGELRIAILLGFNQTSGPRDWGRRSYNHIGQVLKKGGFAVEKYSNEQTAPFAELVRQATETSPKIHVSMSLSFSDKPYNPVYSRRAKEALEEADIVAYLGHSGLGGNLNIQNIERSAGARIRFNNKFQIYYFNACDSLYWYLNTYELEKRGKRNVDIVTNGLESYFQTQDQELFSLLRPFLTNSLRPNWNQILESMEKANGALTFFLNVGSIQ